MRSTFDYAPFLPCPENLPRPVAGVTEHLKKRKLRGLEIVESPEGFNTRMTTNLGEYTGNFTADDIARARQYFSEKRVSRIEFDPVTSMISGIVKEDDNTLFTVKILVQQLPGGRIHLLPVCECGSMKRCHHVPAVLIAIGGAETITLFLREVAEQEAYFRRHPEARPDLSALMPAPQAPDRRAAEPEGRESLPWEVQQWQSQLRSIQEPGESRQTVRKQKPAHTRIVYLLEASPRQRHLLEFSILKVTVTKKGTLSAPRTYTPSFQRKFGRDVTDDDVYIFRMLCGVDPDNPSPVGAIYDDFSTKILETMVATQRCYFENLKAPLTWDKPRPGKAAWMTDSDLRQHTSITVEPPGQVFIGSPMLYLDAAANTIGPVKMQVPVNVAQKWLSAPPIEPRYHKAIAEFSTALHLPAPPPIPEATTLKTVSQSVLTLHSGLWRGAASFATPETAEMDDFVHWGTVHFNYGPVRVSGGNHAAILDKFIDGQRYQISRDTALEKQRTEQLRAARLLLKDQRELMIPDHYTTELVWTLNSNNLAHWQNWMSASMPALEQQGWTIEYDASCKLRRAEIEDWFMDTSAADESDNDWFNVDLGIVVDNERISLVPLLRKIFVARGEQSRDRFLKEPLEVQLPDGRYVRLEPQRLERIRDLLLELFDANGSGPLRADRLRAAQFAGVDGWQWSGSQQVRDLIERIRTASTTATEPPPGLEATLRPYQQHGLTWLQFLRDCNLSGILADDMGLGKTVQTLAHLLCEKQAGRLDRPALVVAPTSLMGNWRQETQRFAPALRVLILHGSGRKEHFEQLSQYDLIVTSYQLLARDEEFLTKQPYHLVILDEAQMVKNPNTLYAQAARKLVTRHRLALTGTPMENHLGELWAIFDFLMPGFLGNNRQFRQLYRDPIEKLGDSSRRKALAQRIAPLILRRRKSEVALELPPKNEMVQEIELSGAQRDLYESIRVTMESHVRDQIANMGLARSHIFILEALLKLRQVCCDPRLLKLPSAQKVTESAKLEWLEQTLPSMIEDGRKILLFSQFTSMLELIEKKLGDLKIKFVRLTGDTRDRDTPVRSFQRGEVPVFLISLKAGGTGLNLTAADTVIHYDPWWNPAVENQATDRAHRIGQDKTVFVYKLITQGTVEEKIQALQKRKRELVAGLLDDTGQTPLKLGDEELRALFAPLG